jgi:multidrug resistance efflux pump
MDGVISSFSVFPNQKVEAGSALFDFDLAPIEARLDVANQSFGTANAEYRQFAQSALTDQKSKTQLAIAIGKIEERRAEAEYLQGLYERAHVLAPQAGTVLFDDPSEWIGRPVITGERIMRIASDDDVEIEAWLSVSDAIPLEAGDQVSLYLNSSPLFSVNAKIRYVAHEAMLRPNGQYGYRVRAALDGKTDHRIGLKGTAKLHGPWTITAYWITRRPLATIRQWLGW